ncbi:MAG: YdcF family protein [Candidatus Aenigmatarchaeota archaeon]
MKVGILHGAGVNPDRSLQFHTKARADVAIKAYKNSIVDRVIVCGKNEADAIASYILTKGVERKDIIIEPFSYSTLSNLYYCKMLLFILSRVEPIDKVYLISSYWHVPRLSYNARKILGEEYQIACLSADDPRNEEEIKKDKRLEKLKFVSDKILVKLGYGKEFNKVKFLAGIMLGAVMSTDVLYTIPLDPREVLESSIDLATPSYQKKLMKLEKMLYKAMKLV